MQILTSVLNAAGSQFPEGRNETSIEEKYGKRVCSLMNDTTNIKLYMENIFKALQFSLLNRIILVFLNAIVHI